MYFNFTDNVSNIQINNGDTLKVIVFKDDVSQDSIIKTTVFLI